MSRFHGPQGGPVKVYGRTVRQPDGREVARNKGVLAAYKAQKRIDAELRAEEAAKAEEKREADFAAASAIPPEAKAEYIKAREGKRASSRG